MWIEWGRCLTTIEFSLLKTILAGPPPIWEMPKRKFFFFWEGFSHDKLHLKGSRKGFDYK